MIKMGKISQNKLSNDQNVKEMECFSKTKLTFSYQMPSSLKSVLVTMIVEERLMIQMDASFEMDYIISLCLS
jgi:hypothetical protein